MLHVVPIMLGDGARLANVGDARLEPVEVIALAGGHPHPLPGQLTRAGQPGPAPPRAADSATYFKKPS